MTSESEATPIDLRTLGSSSLEEHLFDDTGIHSYAILDAALIDGLPRRLGTSGVAHDCLFAGKVDPSVKRNAPFLVELERDSEFTAWLMKQCWGRHWGIFARSGKDLATLRKHLRRFLTVKDPSGKQMFFRYYDPRVFEVYLPTCNEEEIEFVFGPVSSYVFESFDGQSLNVFSRAGRGLRRIAVELIES